MERAERVQTLLPKGQDPYEQRRFEEAIEILRKACQLDPRNPLVRAELSDALAEQARRMLETDRQSAEALIEQALEIDPGHALAKSLRTQASDLRRQEFIDRGLSQARQHEVAGDFERGRAQVEKALPSSPNEPTVSERHASPTKDLTWSHDQQTRLRDLEQLKSLRRNSVELIRQWLKPGALADGEWDSEVAKMQALSMRAETIAKQYPNDPEVKFLATSVAQRLATLTPRPEVGSRSEIPQTPNVPRPGTAPLAPKPRPQEPARPKHTPSPRRASAPPPPVFARVGADLVRALKEMPRWAFVVAGAVVIVGAVFAKVWHIVRPAMQLPVSTLFVEFITSPPDANLFIDGNPSPAIVRLQVGRTYTVEARKDGYRPASQSVNLNAGSDNMGELKRELKLQPLPLVLRVSTDLGESAVRLDDVDRGTIQGRGDFTLDVDPGPHTLTIARGKSKVAIAFEAEAASLPVLSTPIKTTKKFEGAAVVVTAWGNQARVETNTSSLKVGIDDKPAQGVGSGLTLESVAPGSHDLIWGKGKVKRSFEIGRAPTLSLFLVTGRKVQVAKLPPIQPLAPAPKPSLPPTPAATPVDPNAEKIRQLRELAYNASFKGKYVEPQGENAIAYAKQVLAIDNNDAYAKGIIEHCVRAGVSQAREALKDKNVSFARQVANSMAQLLPGRSEIAELQKEIALAEKPSQASQAVPPKPSGPTFSFRVAHIHTKKVPIGNEPYCEGILSVTRQHLRFDAQTATKGQQPHHLDFPSCSGLEIKKNTRIVGIGQPGFHVREGSQKDNFIPEKNIGEVVFALQWACKD